MTDVNSNTNPVVTQANRWQAIIKINEKTELMVGENQQISIVSYSGNETDIFTIKMEEIPSWFSDSELRIEKTNTQRIENQILFDAQSEKKTSLVKYTLPHPIEKLFPNISKPLMQRLIDMQLDDDLDACRFFITYPELAMEDYPVNYSFIIYAAREQLAPKLMKKNIKTITQTLLKEALCVRILPKNARKAIRKLEIDRPDHVFRAAQKIAENWDYLKIYIGHVKTISADELMHFADILDRKPFFQHAPWFKFPIKPAFLCDFEIEEKLKESYFSGCQNGKLKNVSFDDFMMKHIRSIDELTSIHHKWAQAIASSTALPEPLLSNDKNFTYITSAGELRKLSREFSNCLDGFVIDSLQERYDHYIYQISGKINDIGIVQISRKSLIDEKDKPIPIDWQHIKTHYVVDFLGIQNEEMSEDAWYDLEWWLCKEVELYRMDW